MIVTVTDMFDGVTPEASPITISVIEGTATSGSGGGAVDSVNGHVGVVVLDADDIADGATNHAFTAADDTKLAGIATGATANSTDATLLARANHTGVQAISTVTGLQTALDGKDAAGAAAAAQTAAEATASTALTAHVAAADPHPGYLTAAEGNAAYDALGAAAAAQAASQPLDSDLTAIAALTTTSYGRALLALADAAALRSSAGLVLGTDVYSKSAVDSGFQPLDSDLTAIAALSTTSYGRAFLALADAAAARTALALGTAATVNTGTSSGDIPLLTTGGVVALARLGTGTPAASKYVDGGTGAWTALPAAGGSSDDPSLAGADDYAFGGTTTSLPAGYSWETQGTSTYNEQDGRGSLLWDTAAYNYIRGIYRTIPGTFNSVTMKYSQILPGAGNHGTGLILRNSSSGKLLHFAARGQDTVNVTFFSATNGSVGTDISAGYKVDGNMPDLLIQIVRNSSSSWDFKVGSHYSAMVGLSASFLGVNVPTQTQGFTPDQVGIGCLCIPASVRPASIDWIKFT